MANPIKDLFSPQSIVGLQITEGWVSLVQIGGDSGKPVIERSVWKEYGTEDSLEETISHCLQQLAATPDMLVTALSASEVSVRDVPIEMRNHKKLRQIIKYQLEPLVPYPVEDMIVDFLPAEPDQPVTTIGALKGTIAKHLERIGSADLEPSLVTLEDTAVMHLYQMSRKKPDFPIGIIHLRGTKTVFLVMAEHRLLFIRTVDSENGSMEKIRESVDLYRIQHPQHPLKEIVLTGPGADQPETASQISSATGLPVSMWRPLPLSEGGKKDDHTQAKFGVAYALAVAGLKSAKNSIDFRREEFRRKSPYDLSKTAIYGIAVLLLLLGIFTYQVRSGLSEAEKMYDGLNRRATGILTETFPDMQTIIRGRELSQMEQKISETKTRYVWLENLTGSDSVLDLLLVLTKTLSGFKEVKVDNLSIDSSRILLDGRAPSYQVIDNLKGKMERMRYFKTIDLIGAELDGRDRKVRFTFQLEKRS